MQESPEARIGPDEYPKRHTSKPSGPMDVRRVSKLPDVCRLPPDHHYHTYRPIGKDRLKDKIVCSINGSGAEAVDINRIYVCSHNRNGLLLVDKCKLDGPHFLFFHNEINIGTIVAPQRKRLVIAYIDTDAAT